MKKPFALILIVGAMLLAAALACAPTGSGDTSGEVTRLEDTTGDTAPVVEEPVEPAEEPAEPPQEEIPPFEAGPCDSRAMPIDFNVSYEQQMHATDQGYPANCLYYCLWIPDNQSNLSISIADFNTDLDLYIGQGEFESVVGADVVYNETYMWKSNEFGTVDEFVSINNPVGGVYYIEVCSYEGEASPFVLSTELR